MSSPVPMPVHDIANVIGPVIAVASTVLTAVIGSGIVPRPLAARGGALIGLLHLVPPVLGGVLALFAAKAVAVQATPLVSPVAEAPPAGGIIGNLLGGIFG